MGGRPTNPVSLAVLQEFTWSTGYSGRSADTRAGPVSRPVLELIWGFLLLSINRGCEPILRLVDFLVRVLERTL